MHIIIGQQFLFYYTIYLLIIMFTHCCYYYYLLLLNMDKRYLNLIIILYRNIPAVSNPWAAAHIWTASSMLLDHMILNHIILNSILLYITRIFKIIPIIIYFCYIPNNIIGYNNI